LRRDFEEKKRIFANQSKTICVTVVSFQNQFGLSSKVSVLLLAY